VSHYNIAPVIDIYGNVVNTDLASVDKKLEVIVEKYRKQLPRGSQLVVRGQVLTMKSSFIGLIGGLAFSILLVYLLIVVNFQSWLDPFIIISALPFGARGDRVDAVHHPYAHQRARADRLDYVHGRGDGELHSGGELRARAAWR
jgi:multidrug efflux pump subunit AcrB